MVAPPAGSMGPAPLAGRRVLDLGACCAQVPHGLAASMAARLCAAYGAEVVRPVPAGGDPFAHHAPLLPGGGSLIREAPSNRRRSRWENAGSHSSAAAPPARGTPQLPPTMPPPPDVVAHRPAHTPRSGSHTLTPSRASATSSALLTG